MAGRGWSWGVSLSQGSSETISLGAGLIRKNGIPCVYLRMAVFLTPFQTQVGIFFCSLPGEPGRAPAGTTHKSIWTFNSQPSPHWASSSRQLPPGFPTQAWVSAEVLVPASAPVSCDSACLAVLKAVGPQVSERSKRSC